MGASEQCSHVLEKLRVSVDIPNSVNVQEVDELSVEAGLRQREQGVEKDVCRIGEVHRRVTVDPALLLKGQRARPVKCLGHIAETVGFDDVSAARVDDQPANDQPRVEPEVLDRPTVCAEELLQPGVGLLLPRLHTVVHQGVVEVIADGGDRTQIEGPTRVDATLRRNGENGALIVCHVRQAISDGARFDSSVS